MGVPDDFIWGTAATALGAEGSSPASDWRRWQERHGAATSLDGNGFATNAAGDAEAIASLGVRAHRMGVDWARLEPAEGRIDGSEVERLRGRVAALRSAGLDVWLSLWEGPIPGWFADEGGFGDDRARSRRFPRHVDRCGEWFGDLVAGWFPVHEPVSWSGAGFLAGTVPPGRVEAIDAWGRNVRGLLYAQRDAWRQLRGGGPLVATSWHLGPVVAADQTIPAREAARRVDRTVWGALVSALRDGHVVVPGRNDELDVPDLRDCCDVVGLTYRGGMAVTEAEALVPYPPDARCGDDGWAPWAEGLGETLRRVAELLPDRPLLVAGWSAASDDVRFRADQLVDAIGAVEDALRDGVPVRGFFHRSAVDGYEVGGGFAWRTGLFDRDRIPTDVALEYQRMITTGTAR
jgi:beta-glucosidase